MQIFSNRILLGVSPNAGLSDRRRFQQSKEDLKQVAEQFEAIFVDMYLKEARKAELADTLFSNQASDTFQSMLDQEYSKLMSQKTGLGIAEALYKQFKDHVGGEE